MDGRPLSNTVGTVLDPIFALRRRVRSRAGRDGAHRILDHRRIVPQRKCWTWSTSITTPTPSSGRRRWRGPRRRCSCAIWASTPTRRACFSASRAMCSTPTPAMRPSSDIIRRGGGGQAALWAHGHFRRSADRAGAHRRHRGHRHRRAQLLRALEYWRMKRLAVDLVILNERGILLSCRICRSPWRRMVRMSQSRPPIGADQARGAVFLLRADLISQETRALLSSVARVVLVGAARKLSDQLDRAASASPAAPPGRRRARSEAAGGAASAPPTSSSSMDSAGSPRTDAST